MYMNMNIEIKDSYHMKTRVTYN